jgi:hypothetical protein
MSTTADNLPHLAAIATTPENAVTMGDVTLAYRIGYADAMRREVARQVAALRTIEDVRALSDQAGEDYRAGTIDDHEFHRVLKITDTAACELSAAVVVEGCPDWCNAHNFFYGDWSSGDDVSLHRYRVEGDGWSVEIEESEGDEQGPAQYIDTDGTPMPLHRARAQAMAILAGCDAIEATR